MMLCVALALSSATAGWLRAQIDHFIVYNVCGERALRDYVHKLEMFDCFLLS